MAAGNPGEDMAEVLRGARRRGGLSLLTWGLMSAAAFVMAYASWQFAPSSHEAKPVRVVDAVSSTGSIPSGRPKVLDEAPAPRLADVAAAKPASPVQSSPMPPAADVGRLLREIEDLKIEVRDLRRIADRADLATEQMARRMDSIEDQGAVLSRRVEIGLEAARVAAHTAPAQPQAPAPQPVAAKAPEPVPPPAPVQAAQAKPMDAALLEPRTLKVTTRSVPPDAQPTQPIEAPVRKSAEFAPPQPAPAAPEPSAGARAGVSPPPAASPPPEQPTARMPTIAVSAKPAAGQGLTPTLQQVQLAQLAAQVQSQVAQKSAPTPAPEQTASIPSTAATEAPASGFAVDLGGFRSVAQLRKAWSDANAKHAALTKSLAPLAQIKETDDGVEARLVAGPFATAMDANKFCAQVKAAGTNCQPSMYVGQPLQPK